MKHAVEIGSRATDIFICTYANIYKDWFRHSKGYVRYSQRDSVRISCAYFHFIFEIRKVGCILNFSLPTARREVEEIPLIFWQSMKGYSPPPYHQVTLKLVLIVNCYLFAAT
jgi:hypothetical protein